MRPWLWHAWHAERHNDSVRKAYLDTRILRTRQAIYVQRNIEALSCNHCWSGKAISITHSECEFVALGIQHAIRMRCIAICTFLGSTIFSKVSHKRRHFPKKKNLVLNIKYVFFIFCISFVWKILVLRSTGQDIVINVYWSSCKISIIIVRFLRNFSFLDRFSKSTELSDFMKTRLTVSMLFHADRRTDRHDEANSRFSQFHEPTWKWIVASWGVGDTVNI